MDSTQPLVQRFKSSCTECQRRKQKCNRVYPCTHCKTRSKERECRFIEKSAINAIERRQMKAATAAETAAKVTAKGPGAGSKRPYDGSDDSDSDYDSESDLEVDAGNASIRQDSARLSFVGSDGQATGQSSTQLAMMRRRDRPQGKQYIRSPATCPELQSALDSLPRREHLDALVISFFRNVNPHYGIIHRSDFSREYDRWWKKREMNHALPIPLTCLVLMMCACACQHLPVDIQVRLEQLLNSSCKDRTETYHYHARCLHGVAPVGRYHRNNVLWLLHSVYWYKAEAMFSECCHVFDTAVREAQELGFDTENGANALPNFELEMRRRSWCVIDSWDWQIASGLFRNTLIDHNNCRAGRPSLTLEQDGEFSPLLHMTMQTDLVHQLARRYSAPLNVQTYEQLMEYKSIVDAWMMSLPPIFALVNPDKSFDKKLVWIEYHRHYNYTMGYMMLLNPFRPHMKETYTHQSSEEMLELRRVVVDLALILVKVLDNWLKFLTFRDGRFHFIIFSLVDTATVLSNVVMNDEAGTVPRRDDIYRAAKTALVLQRKLLFLSESAKVGFRIVQRLVRRMFRCMSPEYLASLDEGDESQGSDVQEDLPDSAQVPDGGALMCVPNIDPGDPVAPELWSQLAIEAPIEAPIEDVDMAASQLAPDAELVVSGFHNDAPTTCNCAECIQLATYSQCQMNAPHETPVIDPVTAAVAADYTEPVFLYNINGAPPEYISPASLQISTAASPNYGATTPLNLLATTPAYVESMFPEHAPLMPSGDGAFVPLVQVAAAPWNYAASATYHADPPLFVEPELDHQIYPASSSYSTAPTATQVTEFAAQYAGAFPDFTTATPTYVEPTLLSTYHMIPAAEQLVVPSMTITEAISTPAPIPFPDTSASYSASTRSVSLTDYTDGGQYTTPESFDESSGYEPSVLYPVSTGYAPSGSQTSPGSYSSLEGCNQPTTVCDTPGSCTASLIFDTLAFLDSPEPYTSSESRSVPEVGTTIAPTAEGVVSSTVVEDKDAVEALHDTLSNTAPSDDIGHFDI